MPRPRKQINNEIKSDINNNIDNNNDNNIVNNNNIKKIKKKKTIKRKNNEIIKTNINVNKKRITFNDSIAVNMCSYIADVGMVTLSQLDKAIQLELSSDRMECFGCDGGYRMARSTHGVLSGAYYYEVLILPSIDNDINAHVRVGWSTRHGDLQSPVGFDKHSYGYRDIDGSKIHKSERYDNYGDSYSTYDVIGCYIYLDEYDSNSNTIQFYKNGVNQGIAYQGENDIPKSVYFPAVSLYMKAHVAVNFGPSFIITPNTNNHSFIPVSEVQPMSPEERKIHDTRIDNLTNLRLENINKVVGDNIIESTNVVINDVIPTDSTIHDVKSNEVISNDVLINDVISIDTTNIISNDVSSNDITTSIIFSSQVDMTISDEPN